MKKLFYLIAMFCIGLSAIKGQTFTFDWNDPGGLTASEDFVNTSGVSNVEFREGGVLFKVVTDTQKGRQARFYNNYSGFELRIYEESVINIKLSDEIFPEGHRISKIVFKESGLNNTYIEYLGSEGVLSRDCLEWTAAENLAPREVNLNVVFDTKIKSTSVTVEQGQSGVEENLTDDGNGSVCEWSDLHGVRLKNRPQAPGVYFLRRNGKVSKILVR